MKVTDAKVYHLESFIDNYYTVRPFVLSSDYDELKQEHDRLEKFIEQAFQAHPNLDIDIEYENERA